jgi:cardiolipin synthase
VFHSNLENRILISGMIFLLAGISDVTDGYIARKYNLITKFGTVLDPFADKMMSFSVLISYTISGLIPSWIVITLALKELFMILGGGLLYLHKDKKVIPSNKFGKIATFSFYAAILSIVFNIPPEISIILLLITVILNIVAFYNYLKIFLKLNKGNDRTVDKVN